MRTRSIALLLVLAAAPALAQTTAAPQLSAPPPPPVEAAEPLAGPARRIRLYLTDGQELTAVLLGENKTKLRVRVGTGAPFDIARASLRAVEDAEAPPSPENYFRDPNLSRTFYAPTGFRLREGEAYFSQKELVLSSFGYGINDHVSVTVGTIVPMWFVPGYQNLLVGVNAGADLGDVWHFAVGAQGGGYPGPTFSPATQSPQGLGAVHATVTCGTPVINLTVSVGAATHNLGGPPAGATLIAVGSASWRVHQYVTLETENWFFPGVRNFGPTGEPFVILNALGLRLMNKNFAVDLGAVRWPGTFIPAPWVDFTYTFGR